MKPAKSGSFTEQAEQRVHEEALMVAKSTQSPGQTKEQTKLIAKGIEKGIALYKQQQKAKARERDRAKKKALKQGSREIDLVPEEDGAEDFDLASDRAKPALWTAGSIFLFIAMIHLLRYFLGWPIQLRGFDIPLIWSVAGAVLSLGLSLWMFQAARG